MRYPDIIPNLELVLFFLYLVLWLIFSMRLSVEIALAGIAASAAVYWFACAHMGYKRVKDYRILLVVLLGIRYLVLFVAEAAKANIAVIRIVFARKINIEQQLVYFRTDLKSNIAQVTLANSITLAPGSVTVALDDGLYCVHFMDKKFWNGVDDFVFIRRLRDIEKYNAPVSP